MQDKSGDQPVSGGPNESAEDSAQSLVELIPDAAPAPAQPAEATLAPVDAAVAPPIPAGVPHVPDKPDAAPGNPIADREKSAPEPEAGGGDPRLLGSAAAVPGGAPGGGVIVGRPDINDDGLGIASPAPPPRPPKPPKPPAHVAPAEPLARQEGSVAGEPAVPPGAPGQAPVDDGKLDAAAGGGVQDQMRDGPAASNSTPEGADGIWAGEEEGRARMDWMREKLYDHVEFDEEEEELKVEQVLRLLWNHGCKNHRMLYKTFIHETKAWKRDGLFSTLRGLLLGPRYGEFIDSFTESLAPPKPRRHRKRPAGPG